MIILFEGMDKVGKTTLINYLNKDTKFEHIIIDRGPNSYLVYNKLYNRPYEIDYYKTEMDLRNSTYLCVYCYAEEETIKDRLNQYSENWDNRQGTILDVKKEFDKKMAESNLDILYLNTSKFSIDESIKLIKEEIDKRRYDFIKLKVKYKDNNYIEYYPSINTFSETLLELLPAFNKEIDEPYYTMLEGNLNHLLHKYSINWVNHRQIVYTSLDCISMIQIILNEDITEIFIHQRSLDLNKQATNDLMFIYTWAKNNLKYNKLFIHYNVGIPHKFL